MTASPDDTRSAAPATPRAAATILLLREIEDRAEVLMVRRHANLAFMAGMWVFPGGVLHPSDYSPAALALIDTGAIVRRLGMRDLHDQPLPTTQSAGLAFAACRETFEETGVLLATRADGSACDGRTLDRIQESREAVASNATLFVELLQREQLRPDVSTLLYWAHWITPSSAPKRFDTRFFVLRAPESHLASADTSETVESAWMTPAALLDAARNNAMPISHPTQCNLHDLNEALQRHGSLDRLFAAEATRPVPPILPKMFPENGRTTIVMPWDSAYEKAPGEGVAIIRENSGALGSLPSRVTVDKAR